MHCDVAFGCGASPPNASPTGRLRPVSSARAEPGHAFLCLPVVSHLRTCPLMIGTFPVPTNGGPAVQRYGAVFPLTGVCAAHTCMSANDETSTHLYQCCATRALMPQLPYPCLACARACCRRQQAARAFPPAPVHVHSPAQTIRRWREHPKTHGQLHEAHNVRAGGWRTDL